MRRAHVVFVGLVAARLGTLVACKDPTQITVELTTDVKCHDLQGTSITVGSLDGLNDRPLTTETATCDPDRSRIGSMVIVPSGSDDETVAILVVVGLGRDPKTCSASKPDAGCIVARRAIRFVPHTSLTLPIFMGTSCEGIACGATDTCVRGNCKTATVPDPDACVAADGCNEEVLVPGGPTPTADAGDAGDAASAETSAPECSTQPGSPCSTGLAAGWTPIAYAASLTQPCPPGYTTTDLVKDPGDAGAACTCSCTISATDPPSCAQGTFSGYAGTGVCNNPSLPYTANGGVCVAYGSSGPLSDVAKYAPLPLTPGTCMPAPKASAAFAASSARACVPTAQCQEDVCRGMPPTGFASCIVHDGNVACPAAPFANRTFAGDSAAVACGGCATCANTATCSGARLRFYNDPLCATEVASRLVNDVCNQIASGTPGAVASHYKYEVMLSGAKCNMTSSPVTTSFTLGRQRTICCR